MQNTGDSTFRSNSQLGSGPQGGPVLQLLCANTSVSPVGMPDAQCDKVGSLMCSKCRLVSYCSKPCQTLHWKRHRLDCKSPFLDSAWKPAWVSQNRAPDFVTMTNDAPLHQPFGPLAGYLWGNVAAIDCINFGQNEGKSDIHRDLNLCFAASGDIRNLISTVNSLPSGYRGKCNILFNDLNPLIVGRNIAVLSTLLQRGLRVEDTAELALHIMYSISLTPSMKSSLSTCAHFLESISSLIPSPVPIRGKGKISVMMGPHDLQEVVEMLRSTYSMETALYSYKNVMLAPKRLDYRDRYMAFLEPGHRLGFSAFRKTGVVAPFSLSTTQFTEPNRLLFSRRGEWLIRDSENPLFGWDVSAVQNSGRKHGVSSTDVYGNLFFHVKDELIKFSERMQNCNINITMTQLDACDLPGLVLDGALAPFGGRCFDRIETSNLSDYLTMPRILKDWSPLLSRRNKHATLLVNSMNWGVQKSPMPLLEKKYMDKYGSFFGFDMRQLLRQGEFAPNMFHFLEHIGAFADDNKEFQTYLRGMRVEDVASSLGMRSRNMHLIYPKGHGCSLRQVARKVRPDITREEFYELFILGGAQHTTRFVEFEVKN